MSGGPLCQGRDAVHAMFPSPFGNMESVDTRAGLQQVLRAVQANLYNFASAARNASASALQQSAEHVRQFRVSFASDLVAGASQYGSDCGLFRDGQITGKLSVFVRSFLDGTIYRRVGILGLVQAAQDFLDTPAPMPVAAAAQVASNPDPVMVEPSAVVCRKRKRSRAVLRELCQELARIAEAGMKEIDELKLQENEETARSRQPDTTAGAPSQEADVPDSMPVCKERPNKDVLCRIRRDYTDQVLYAMVGVMAAAWGVQADDRGFSQALHWSIGKKRRLRFSEAGNSLDGANEFSSADEDVEDTRVCAKRGRG